MTPALRDSPRSFYGLSRLILSSGPLGYTLAHTHRGSYVQVELLDKSTGRLVCVLDKVNPNCSVLEMKNRFHKTCPRWYPSHTGFSVRAGGPVLHDSCVVKTITGSSLLTLYCTDLGRQVSWTTVFLWQCMGPLLLYLMFYCRLAGVYEGLAQTGRPLVVHLACFCHSLHYTKRLLETLFVHRLSDGYTPLSSLLKVCAFYWGFTFWLGYYINHPLYTPPNFANKQIIPSFVCFLICEAGNFFINVALSQHCQAAGPALPPRPTRNPFTWLFQLVRCPQYTYEMGAWISLAIMTQTVAVAVFAALVSVQMLLWGKRRQHKYLCYPRAAVIPLML